MMPAIVAAGGALIAANSAHAASGTWSFLNSGLWGVSSNWAGGAVADGASSIADFSTLNITADATVSLDSPRTVGTLKFADATTQSNNWTLDNSGNASNILTLNNGASQPVITIGNGSTTGQITTISATIAGSNGFIKNGPGALQLTGNNTFTGTVTLNSGTSGTGSDLYLGSNGALGAASNVLFVDPGNANLTRVRLNAGVVIPNPIVLHTVRAPLQNGVIQTNGNVSATLTGPITIDGVVGSGGDFSGPNDTTLTNFLTITGPITISNQYPAGNLTNANNNGVVTRTGNIILAGGGSYFRIEQRTGELRLGANNGIATNAYLDLGVNNGNPTTSFNSTLDLFGFNQTLVGIENLSQNGTVTNSANAPSTLTLTPGIAAGQPTPPNLTFGGSIMSDAQATQPNSLLSVVVNGSASGLQTFNNASSSYHGATTILSGTLAVNTLANGGAISSIGASTSDATNLVLGGGGALRYTGTSVSTDRNFTLNASTTSTIDVSSAAATLTMTGAGTGGGGLVKAGAGTLLLTGNHAYAGNTSVSAGALMVNGSLPASSSVSIAGGALLGGTGNVGGVVSPASGGIVSPAGSGAVGTITVGALALNTGAQVNFEFDSSNDEVTVANAGGLALNGGNLFLYNTGTTSAFASNGTYTLFNLNGGFAGSVDNLTVSNPVAGKFYNITGTSSAVTLAIGDATTVGWTDNNSTDLWTDAGNWAGGVIPNAVGQTANFAAPGGGGSVNLNGNKTVSGLIFNNSSTRYDIFGNGVLTIDNGSAAGAITVGNGSHAIDVPIALNGAVSVMTTNGSDSLAINGNISGAFPLNVAGPGAVTLTGANTFTTLSLSASTLNVGNGGAGGSLGTGPVTLSNAANLNFNTSSNYNFGQNITGAGTVSQIGSGTTTVAALNVTAVNASNGALITSGINQSSGVHVTGSGRLTANGAVSGAGSLVVNTSGAVSLGAANTYTGGTEIDAGTVTLNAVGALPNNSALAVNGGTLDLNAKNISITNILDNGTAGGVITNNGAAGTTSTVSFTGNATNFGTATTGVYNAYAALNDGLNGGKVALVSAINNVNLGTYSLALHAASTYSGGTSITRQSIDAYDGHALGTGSVVLQSNTASTNVTHLGVAGGITLPNDVTIVLPNGGGASGAIQYLPGTTGSATLTGAITVQANTFTGGTFAGPVGGDVLNINGPVTATGGTTAVSVIAGNVAFGGGGSYPQLDVFGNANAAAPGVAIVGVPNGISTGAVVNVVAGTLDLRGNNQTIAGLSGPAGGVTNSTGTAAVLTLNTSSDHTLTGSIDGNLSLVKSGAAAQTLAGFTTYSGVTTVAGGALVLKESAWFPVLNGAGADIQNGRAVFDYSATGTPPDPSIQSLLASSYANNGFNNSNSQLRSSTANSSRGLGWRDDGTKVVVAAALYGDSDLNGSVDLTDFTFLAANFNRQGTAIWVNGDYNYDGNVDLTDFTMLAANFNRSLPAGDAAAAAAGNLGAPVPEPTGLAFLASGALTLMARRRRR